jgi:MoaA/NifB/PqqE/SkfB family radical SAM enzyme
MSVMDLSEESRKAELEALHQQINQLSAITAESGRMFAKGLAIIAERLEKLEAAVVRLERKSPYASLAGGPTVVVRTVVPPAPRSAAPAPAPASSAKKPLTPPRRTPFATNLDRQVRELNEGATELQSYPTEMAIDLTSRSNLECVLGRNRTENVPAFDFEVSRWQEVKTFLPYLRAIYFGGIGEPLLYPRIEEVLTDLQAHPVILKVVSSNGLLLNDERLTEVVVRSVNRLAISLEGATKETYERFRTGASFDRLVNNLERVQSLANAANGKPLEIIFQTVPLKGNLAELPELVRLAHRLGVRHIVGQHLVSAPGREEFEREQSVRDIPEEYNRTLAEMREVAHELKVQIGLPGKFPLTGEAPAEAAASLPKKCAYPWKYFQVARCPDYEFAPCGFMPVGNLGQQDSITAAWNCEAMKKIRATVNSADPADWPKKCQTCACKR